LFPLLHNQFGYQKKALRFVPSIADSNIHTAFDKGECLLLPEDRIIEEFYKALDNARRVKRENFPTLPVCAFDELVISGRNISI
jgi:hypothetical protein